MNPPEVVVTGAGLTTPLGTGVEANWLGVQASRTGIAHFPRQGLPNCFQYFGKVRELSLPAVNSRSLAAQMKFLSRGAQLGFAAACEATEGAGVDLAATTPGRRALYIASGDYSKAGFEFLYPVTREATGGNWEAVDFETLNQATLTSVNPFFLLESIPNNLFSFLSAFYDFKGPNTSLASLSPCGNQALELACRSIQQGRSDVALAVGYGHWITEIPIFDLEGLGLLSKCRAGAASFRPFDRSRDGFIPGEGGAALFLENAELAGRRGARIMATIRGSTSGVEPSAHGSFGVVERVSLRCMRKALEDARGGIDELAFVSAHGSATRKGDRSELLSCAELLAGQEAQVPICGMKSYTGHMGAASDLAEIILGIKAAAEGIVPGTLNYTKVEDEFSQLNLSGCHQRCVKRSFLSTSYGLGGQASAIVVTV
jgi:3-oxoacyl-[acyl-carrier-protein] synthase II